MTTIDEKDTMQVVPTAPAPSASPEQSPVPAAPFVNAQGEFHEGNVHFYEEEAAPSKPKKQRKAKKPRRRMGYHFGMKALAFVMLLFMGMTTVLGVISAVFFTENDFYSESYPRLQTQFLMNAGEQVAFDVLSYLDDYDSLDLYDALDRIEALDTYCTQDDVYITVSQAIDGESLLLYAVSGQVSTHEWSFTYYIDPVYTDAAGNVKSYTISGASGNLTPSTLSDGYYVMIAFTPKTDILTVLTQPDTPLKPLSLVNIIVVNGYANRYNVYVSIILAVLIGLVCFVYLVRAVGHRPQHSDVCPSAWAKIPLELSLCLWCLPLGCCIAGFLYAWAWELVLAGVLACVGIAAVLLLWLLDMIVRYKCDTLATNTLVYRVGKACGRSGAAAGKGCLYFAKRVPLVQLGVVSFVILTLANVLLFLLVGAAWGAWGLLVLLWFIEYLVVFAAVVYFLLVLRRLALAGEALAMGDLTYQVPTKHLYMAFKDHADNLNQIGVGLTRAVEERLRSERMKTELITNVSHDIKTPLTSIINYSDLLSKEETSNEKIIEYTGVIARQSERLKRLMEDLVEASKASTGNLEVNLLPCEVGVLLAQAVGEYENRMAQQGLSLVVKQPEEALSIMADGRRLWRVFDNLMSNICKYTQEGTRVYLSIERVGQTATITFKNISKYPLDVTADELLERFVRGGASRHDEGNGLGLSIAQSLVELQGGTMQLAVDGDLFKATITFALLA